jgi:hypothetical protein
MKANSIAGAGLNTNTVENAKKDVVPGTDKTYFELYAYVSATNATSFMGFVNLDRQAYANYNDETRLFPPRPRLSVLLLREQCLTRTSVLHSLSQPIALQ